MAGYSGTPLPQKLGIKPNHVVLVTTPPKTFSATLGKLPDGVKLSSVSNGRFDVAVVFFTRAAELEQKLPSLKRRMQPAAGLWVGWPKKASGVSTDITEDVVRRMALEIGLVDNKVCAIDDTWSGLRLVIRVADRPTAERLSTKSARLSSGRRRARPAAGRAPGRGAPKGR